MVGKIDLRIGHNDKLYIGGNIGYNVSEEYRGNNYAEKACRILFPFAKNHNLEYLIITCKTDNIPSYRTLENCGGILLEIAKVPEDSDMYQRGYRFVKVFKFIL